MDDELVGGRVGTADVVPSIAYLPTRMSGEVLNKTSTYYIRNRARVLITRCGVGLSSCYLMKNESGPLPDFGVLILSKKMSEIIDKTRNGLYYDDGLVVILRMKKLM